jgi:hypothetical protein
LRGCWRGGRKQEGRTNGRGKFYASRNWDKGYGVRERRQEVVSNDDEGIGREGGRCLVKKKIKTK